VPADAGYADGLPGPCGQEPVIAGAIAAGPQRPVYPDQQHTIAASAIRGVGCP
jgi:hypothetical protein